MGHHQQTIFLRITVIATVVALGLVYRLPAWADGRLSPVVGFKNRIHRALAIRHDPVLQNPEMVDRQKQQIWPLIDAAFDETLITPQVLATTWPRLSPAQKAELGPLMSWAIKWKFIGKLYKYNVREISFGVEGIENGRYVLQGRITGRWVSHPFRFVFHSRHRRWAAADLVLRGASLVAHYRRKFDGTYARRGFNGLLEQILSEVNEEFQEMGYRPEANALLPAASSPRGTP